MCVSGDFLAICYDAFIKILHCNNFLTHTLYVVMNMENEYVYWILIYLLLKKDSNNLSQIHS